MTTKHIMVDLETMGTQPGRAIVSIGAVAFCPHSGSISKKTFYTAVSLKSCTAIGMKIEPDTLMWWLKQSDAARLAIANGGKSINVAIGNFTNWFDAHNAEFLWGHGSVFDEPILRAAYRMCGRTEPWKFYNVRDTRTIFDISGVSPNRSVGTHHNALDDARAQAVAVIEAYRKLGVARHV